MLWLFLNKIFKLRDIYYTRLKINILHKNIYKMLYIDLETLLK